MIGPVIPRRAAAAYISALSDIESQRRTDEPTIMALDHLSKVAVSPRLLMPISDGDTPVNAAHQQTALLYIALLQASNEQMG